jgi:hypothetical protein
MPGGPLVTSRAARVGRTKRKSRGLAGQRYFAVVRAFGFRKGSRPPECSPDGALSLDFCFCSLLCLLVSYRPLAPAWQNHAYSPERRFGARPTSRTTHKSDRCVVAENFLDVRLACKAHCKTAPAAQR